MMAVAIAALVLWRRGRALTWRPFAIGALAWTVGVALKFAWAVPTTTEIQNALNRSFPPAIAGPIFWAYAGLLTGIFECISTLVFVKRTKLKHAGWNDAVAFGIGFGAIEAFLLGFAQFVGILVSIAMWSHLPDGARRVMNAGTALGLTAVPLPVIERISALVVHAMTCVVIVYGVRAGRSGWFWLSFVFKSAVDGYAAWAIVATQLTKSLSGLIEFEAAVGVFAAFGFVVLAFLRGRFRRLPVDRDDMEPAEAASDPTSMTSTPTGGQDA
jgi:uncharacterized membrane protein YhfC